ncbi:MAG TPA: hypothetical protein VFQ36_01355 [Ktedonobacteraceae bacterium]|nr:hypothetical protein [Ktedonobacteraceae bacterium]
MSTQSTISPTTTGQQQASGVERFAAVCAVLAGIVGFLYSISFVVLKIDVLTALCLMLGGLLATVALSGLYSRVRQVETNLASWAWILGVVGALGAAIHGGYDLANAIHPPAPNFAQAIASLPSSIDPRGLLTFGVAGLSFFGFAWLIGRSASFSRPMSYLTYLLALLLVVLYLARLIILDAKSPVIAGVGGLSGFIVNPLWYLWLGAMLLQGRKKAAGA